MVTTQLHTCGIAPLQDATHKRLHSHGIRSVPRIFGVRATGTEAVFALPLYQNTVYEKNEHRTIMKFAQFSRLSIPSKLFEALNFSFFCPQPQEKDFDNLAYTVVASVHVGRVCVVFLSHIATL